MASFAVTQLRCLNCKSSKSTGIHIPVGSRTAHRRIRVVAFASEAPETEAPSARPAESAQDAEASPGSSDDMDWVNVMLPEELPKGVRKEVRINGKSVLMFWYRNEIYAIDARSPAEGAYSEGFIKAKFTQDFGIECPTTGSVFNLKDGSITSWYPTNPVLRAITPQTAKLAVYPVKLTQDGILVAVGDTGAVSTRGGADTSLESNNVFALQPPTYLVDSDGEETDVKAPVDVSTAATFSVAIAAFGIIAVAGTATALFLEDTVLLGAFWALILSAGGYFVYQYNQNKNE